MNKLSHFLLQEDSSFEATLEQSGGYIMFSKSGKRGSPKTFHIGLEALYETLKDIDKNLQVFSSLQNYEEKTWRDNGHTYFSNPVARSIITVQTKPLFSTLSKLIKWSNPEQYKGISTDEHIVLNKETLSSTVRNLRSIIDVYTPTSFPQDTHPPLQIIYYGAPGTGKSYKIKQLKKNKETPPIRTTFHPDSDYATFVGTYKPTMEEVPCHESSSIQIKEKRIIYKFVPQAFLKAYIQAWAHYPTPQYLIIEEINRGNCAQIFGDLFQLLDRSESGFSEYPTTADSDLCQYLCEVFQHAENFALNASQQAEINALYTNEYEDMMANVKAGKLLLLPNNLHILATMNTSDQSLFPIDSAFKRRWEWEYIPIRNAEKGWIIQADGKEWDWWTFLDCINKKIGSITESEDKKLGYFFVKPPDNHTIKAETFVGKVIFYLWNDVFQDYGFNDEEFQTADGTLITFPMFYETNIKEQRVNESLVAHFLQNVAGNPMSTNVIENNSTQTNRNEM